MIVAAGRRKSLPDTEGLSLREAQRVWAVAAQSGNARAFERLIESTEGYIRKISLKWAFGMLGGATPSQQDIEDMAAECRLRLYRVLDRFDAKRGCWMTFAHWQIKHAVTRWVISQGRSVRIAMPRRWMKIKRAYIKLLQELGREPSNEEVSLKCGVPVTKIVRDRETAAMHSVSADASMDVEGEYDPLYETLSDQTVPPPLDEFLAKEGRERLRAWLLQLTPREREVLQRRYGLYDRHEQILNDVGAHFGVSRERIRQVELGAIRQLRKIARREGFDVVE